MYVNGVFQDGRIALNWSSVISIAFILFNIFNALLVGVSLNLGIMRVRELAKIGAGKSVGIFGAVLAILTGVCPGCIFGFFPLLMSLLGFSSFSLFSLPLYGLEIQIAATVLLFVSIYYLSKPTTCRI